MVVEVVAGEAVVVAAAVLAASSEYSAHCFDVWPLTIH